MGSEKSSSVSRYKFEKRMIIVRFLWCGYSLVGLLALCVGVWRNGGGRKFVPAHVAAKEEMNCGKVYVDVHSLSPENSIICCDDTMSYHDEWPWTSTSYEKELCDSKPRKLPLARALTHFPEAWLIPILTVLLHLLCINFLVINTTNSTLSNKNNTRQNIFRTSFQRIGLYVSIMCFRGFILYLFLDLTEGFIVKWNLFSKGTFTTTTQRHNFQTDNECWFSYLSRPGANYNICNKQEFDFSDHVVFFFSHQLPLIAFEAIVWFQSPFLRIGIINGSLPKIFYGTILSCLLPLFIYLSYLSFLSVYRTSAFFHTAAEILLGYAASLLVQIPLGILVCTNYWNNISILLGLPSYPTRED